nr:MAG TPA: hypothetical protein [Caudoviricetes sp.]
MSGSGRRHILNIGRRGLVLTLVIHLKFKLRGRHRGCVFRVLQETQGAMPDVGKKYLANIVLIPQLQVTFDFVVAAMPDSNGFLSVCRGPAQRKRELEVFRGHVRRRESHALPSGGILALDAVTKRTAIEAGDFSFHLRSYGLERTQQAKAHPGECGACRRIDGRRSRRLRELIRSGNVGGAAFLGHLDAVREKNRQDARNLRSHIAIAVSRVVSIRPDA